MKMKAIFTLIICAMLLNDASAAIQTKAKQAILVDFDTGNIIFEKNALMAMTPSSMSKLMTVYVVFNKLQKKEIALSDEVVVSEKAWRKQGSKMFLQVGTKVSIEDLLKGIIIQSGNDACIAIAEGIAGSEETFVELMNGTAKEIGLNNSNFANTTGWPDPNHYMSAQDIATLSAHIVKKFPEYYHYFAEREFVYNSIKQQNRNMLLDMNIGVDGLKTGHTDEGGYGIAVSAKNKERRLIMVVNGLSGTVERAQEASKLLQYGFLNYTNAVVAKKGHAIDEGKLWMSKDNTLPLTVEEDVIFTVAKDQLSKMVAKVEYQSPIIAPIKKGQHLGTLKVVLPDGKEKIYPLVAGKEAVKLSALSRITKNLDYYLFGK
jgi:D-alanyl-D-alanine carboxypeptidase (penicillin-binding protein 5/6)